MTSVSRPVGVNGVKGWVDVGCMEYKKRDGTFLGITGVKREDDPDVTDEFVDQLLQRQEQTLLPSQNSQPSSAPTTTDPTLLSTSTSVSVRYDPTLLSESTSVKLNLEPSSNSMW
eukprot:CAMPEP_0113299518 /NCGR_PEP_ID=MMETSP0010_2-20120614/1523_1 /TAXON_ID=216773 ORGANISM="Corethron hystrix, Strain 308" /NCGR_SAMPLE_ID=MMETSP0010_2 /ASSEMBLY_ACC=CAM_ASM_000155 /LENGTH=114 /DNA_ID=CAMNT_0000152773 /DNA_START=1084 /DNA_END=1425 /DNA_ORIENTATION=+ /assembly_acc=CAM_ASM_000155